MFLMGPILILLGCRRLRRGHRRRQLPQRLHLPDPLGEERHLAGLAVPEMLDADRRPGQHPDRELAGAPGRVPELRLAHLGPLSAGRAPGRAALPGPLLRGRAACARGMPGGRSRCTRSRRSAYHAVLAALLVAATFIDYDLFIIPDQITVTGMVLGLGLGTLDPRIRLEPSAATSPRPGLLGRVPRHDRRRGGDAGGPRARIRGCSGARPWASAT